MAARHFVGGTFLAALRHLLAMLAAHCVRCAAHNAPSVKKHELRSTQGGGRRFGTKAAEPLPAEQQGGGAQVRH